MAADRKSDARLQENSFAYELFEKNINVPLQDVEVGTLLGRGGFGKVYKGRLPLLMRALATLLWPKVCSSLP